MEFLKDISKNNEKSIDKTKTKKIVEMLLLRYSEIVDQIRNKEFKKEYLKNKCCLNLGFEFFIEDIINKMNIVLEALNVTQRFIISERYLRNFGNNLDGEVLDVIEISERTYYREKHKAILTIAEVFNVFVYKNIQ